METDKKSKIEISKLHYFEIEQAIAILRDERLESWKYDDFAAEIKRKDSLALVGKVNDRIVSFCIARLITPINISFNDSSFILADEKGIKNRADIKSECDIYNFAVKTEFQNQGIGSRLLNCLIKSAEKSNTGLFWLEVRCSNRRAINFYQKNNFKQAYTRKNFYSNPVENAIVMKRIL